MDDPQPDDFYEGPPLEEPEHWHDGAIVDQSPERRAEREQPLEETPLPETGAYLAPEVVERPHSAADGLPPASLTRDPSLSRAVDRDAAGMEPEAGGYDRSIEGPSPGPLEPDAEAVPADSDSGPSGEG